jgi:hypothetical protein
MRALLSSHMGATVRLTALPTGGGQGQAPDELADERVHPEHDQQAGEGERTPALATEQHLISLLYNRAKAHQLQLLAVAQRPGDR